MECYIQDFFFVLGHGGNLSNVNMVSLSVSQFKNSFLKLRWQNVTIRKALQTSGLL